SSVNNGTLEYCSRALLRDGSWAPRLGDGAASRSCGSIRIGRSCTPCVAPAQNGGASTRAAPARAARGRPRPLTRKDNAELIETSHAMTFTQYAAKVARTFMTVELAMASVNRGAPVTHAQAEKLLDEYFALIEQAVPLTEDNPLDRRC